MNIETASLVLRTNDISSSMIGLYNDEYTNFTWNNINLRVLLGTMYDKYDLFNLTLKEVSSSIQLFDYFFNSPSVMIYCSGLPFCNQTYNFNNNTFSKTNYTAIGTYKFNNDETGGENDYVTYDNQKYINNRYITFDKAQDQCNFNIFYKDAVDNSAIEFYGEKVEDVSTLERGPDMMFMFEIYGIPKEDGNKNGTRLNINSANSFGI